MDWFRYYGGDFYCAKVVLVLNKMEEVHVKKFGVSNEYYDRSI